jgi:hypothetical protein
LLINVVHVSVSHRRHYALNDRNTRIYFLFLEKEEEKEEKEEKEERKRRR